MAPRSKIRFLRSPESEDNLADVHQDVFAMRLSRNERHVLLGLLQRELQERLDCGDNGDATLAVGRLRDKVDELAIIPRAIRERFSR